MMATPAARFPYVQRGNLKSSKVLVLLAGFPDNETSGWDPLIDRLSAQSNADYRIICLCLPGFEDVPAVPVPRWGYTFDQLVATLHATLEDLLPGADAKFSLIIHDWGSYVGMMYQTRHPDKVKAVVVLDVGVMDPGLASAPLYHVFVICFYQWCFAFSFVVSALLGSAAGQAVFLLASVVMRLIPSLSPCPHERLPRPFKAIKVRMCYPYLQIWLDIFMGRNVHPRFPDVPVLYLFGTRKNVLFHSPSFLRRLDDTAGCRWRSFDCGHWLMHYEADGVADEVLHFLADVK